MPLSQPQKPFTSKHLLISIIFIISIGVYFNALSNDFVSDDESQILQNPWIKDVKYMPDIFFSNIWAFKNDLVSNYYRPLVHVIYTIVYHIFGLNPWGFHLTYVVFHAGGAILVFFIVSALVCQPSFAWPVFAASLLFVTHPINTEAVNLGGPDPFFAFFYLLSFYLYVTSDAIWGKRFVLSIFFFFVSALCKETALTLPILLLAYDYSFKKGPALFLWPKTFHLLTGRYIPYLFAAGIYFSMRIYAIGSFAPSKTHQELILYQCFINIFPLFAQYLEKLVFPVNLSYFHVLHPIYSIFEWKGLAAVCVTLLFIFITYLFRKNSIVFLGLLWIVIPLLPVFYIPALGENTFAERYLYLPSVGFVILASLAIKKAYELRLFGQITGSVITLTVIALTILYSIGTMKRNFIYKDNFSLWHDTVEKSPDGAVPHNNLGIAYSDKRLIEEAIEQYQIAINLKPSYPNTYPNLGAAYYKKGFIDKAIEYYQDALILAPYHPDTYYNLGIAYNKKGLIDKAIEYYQAAIKLNPNISTAHHALGNVYHDRGWVDKAIEQYQIALRLKPNYPGVHYDLGIVYHDIGLLDKAMEHYQNALRLKRDFPEAHNNLGVIYAKIGQIDKAIGEFQMSLQLKPEYAEARNNLGMAYKDKGLREGRINSP